MVPVDQDLPMKRFSAVFGLLAVAACHNDPTPITSGQFCDKYAEEVCAAVSPACLEQVATCTTIQHAQCAASAQQAVGQFRDFVPNNAEACLRKVNEVYGKLNQGLVALKATDIQAMNATCDRVYEGSSPANGPCAADADCLGNLICDKGYCGTRSYVAQGAGCANVGETCQQGSYCGQNAAGLRICIARLGLQNACDENNPCLESLRCSAGVCQSRLDISEPCTADDECSSNFCEPYVHVCADDVRFAHGNSDCVAMGGAPN